MEATPIRVPTVSNRSTNRKEKTITANSTMFFPTHAKSKANMVGAFGMKDAPERLGIREYTSFAGSTWYQPVS